MKRLPRAFADWKIVLILWLVLFSALLWYAIVQRFDDLWLAAIALALAAWGVCSWGVFTVRKWQQWRATARRE
jgi:hypothetical protein